MFQINVNIQLMYFIKAKDIHTYIYYLLIDLTLVFDIFDAFETYKSELIHN